mmetsp:Transcript_24872/g.49924  ORF Transcript_24872/g.49924 Transcript_24872/m.49924 type:complete len:217 (-) Transcript_24872:1452-2102(-)
MLRPPLHFEDPSHEHSLLVLNHKCNTQAVLFPDVCKVLTPTHPALAAMHALSAAFTSQESLRAFCMHSGRLFTEWLADHSPPDKHSLESVQWHGYEAWHACTNANGIVVQERKTKDGPGTFTPIYHKPSQADLWDDAIKTFLLPNLAALMATRDLLPESVCPKWLSNLGLHGTGMTYIGMNVLPGREWGLGQFTWEGTFDPSTGERTKAFTSIEPH